MPSKIRPSPSSRSASNSCILPIRASISAYSASAWDATRLPSAVSLSRAASHALFQHARAMEKRPWAYARYPALINADGVQDEWGNCAANSSRGEGPEDVFSRSNWLMAAPRACRSDMAPSPLIGTSPSGNPACSMIWRALGVAGRAAIDTGPDLGTVVRRADLALAWCVTAQHKPKIRYLTDFIAAGRRRVRRSISVGR